jgi:hypothetical protein
MIFKLASHKHTISQGKGFLSNQEETMTKHSMHLQPKQIVILLKSILILKKMQLVSLGQLKINAFIFIPILNIPCLDIFDVTT